MNIFLIVLSAVETFALITILIIFITKKMSKKIIKEKDGIRYTKSDETKNDQGQVATYIESDIVLPVDKIFKVSKTGDIKPGRYNILSSQEDIEKVNLRVNGISRSQPHNSGIIFAEGDIVMAEKYSIILR